MSTSNSSDSKEESKIISTGHEGRLATTGQESKQGILKSVVMNQIITGHKSSTKNQVGSISPSLLLPIQLFFYIMPYFYVFFKVTAACPVVQGAVTLLYKWGPTEIHPDVVWGLWI